MYTLIIWGEKVLYIQYAQHTMHDSVKGLDYILMRSVLRFLFV